MKAFFKSKVLDPIINLLLQGVTPEKIALSIAYGAVLGVFPILGSTVILCTAATFLFRLNFVAIQISNYLIYPLQLILFIPFIRLGETILGTEPFPLSMEKIFTMLADDMIGAIKTLWVTNLHGIFAWFLTGPITIFLLYTILKPIIRKIPLKQFKEANNE
jgi:uncharacterized protein (DUF2062 family)